MTNDPLVQESARVCPEHGNYAPANFCCACTREDLLHAMHDAAKFADRTTKAILEGVLHRYGYGSREGKYGGNRCGCPHCAETP